jgi:hypothetical protein
MHPALKYELIQARQHDLMRSAAGQRLAAQAQAARRSSDNGPAVAAPRRRVLRLVWRLLPA